MNKFIISCCSTVDLSKEHLDSRDIKYVCFHYQLDGNEYLDDFGQTIPLPEFYKKMTEGAMTKTSQVNASEYEDHFRKYLDQGFDILHLTLSSGISGTINSAKVAAMNLKDDYPDRQIIVLDSLCASAGYGLLMDQLASLRDSGMDIIDANNWVEENKKHLNHWFFASDLTFFVRGGRISKTAGFVGNALNICPLLIVDKDGKLVVREKIRPKKKVIKVIVDRMAESIDSEDYDKQCFISHSACYEDAKAVADLVEKRFPKLKGKVKIYDIGTTIGSHTGPGTVALFFWGKDRSELLN